LTDSHIIINKTIVHEKLLRFFSINGLEESEQPSVDEEFYAAWELTDKKNGCLAGAMLLVKRKGEYVLDSIAVAPPYRNKGLGKALMETALRETDEQLSGKNIYLVAKTPLFFRKFGFEAIDWQDVPQLFDCLTCPQYRSQCNPVPMFLKQ
jgi:amino-acid N-acetyltransferase